MNLAISKPLRISIVTLVSVYIWYINFSFFEVRGFGYDHLYYKKLLTNQDFKSFFIIYISEGATEPISALFFYTISALALTEDLKFFLAREIIFLIFIYRFFNSNQKFMFGILIYLTPLMQTLFQSNLRQGLSIAILVFLLPIWKSLVPFIIGSLSHLSVSTLVLLRVLRRKSTLFFSIFLIPALIALISSFMHVDLFNTLSEKLVARFKVTEIQNIGYLFHLFIIILIYLFLNDGSIARLNVRKVYIAFAVILFFIVCIPLNNVPQRLVPIVWLLPIYEIYKNVSPRNYTIPLCLLFIYFTIMWLKTI